MEYWSFYNGHWIEYIPLDGLDPSFSDSALKLGSVIYAREIVEGKSILEAHNSAEMVMFNSQRSLGNIMSPKIIKKNRMT